MGVLGAAADLLGEGLPVEAGRVAERARQPAGDGVDRSPWRRPRRRPGRRAPARWRRPPGARARARRSPRTGRQQGQRRERGELARDGVGEGTAPRGEDDDPALLAHPLGGLAVHGLQRGGDHVDPDAPCPAPRRRARRRPAPVRAAWCRGTRSTRSRGPADSAALARWRGRRIQSNHSGNRVKTSTVTGASPGSASRPGRTTSRRARGVQLHHGVGGEGHQDRRPPPSRPPARRWPGRGGSR